jgi:predicted ATPase
MKKYAFVGTHGAGKTTLVHSLRDRFLREFPDKHIEVVEEVARSCPFPISDKMSGKKGLEETYIWITLEQMKRETEAAFLDPDYIICDRGVLDPEQYFDGEKGDILERIEDLAHEWAETYDKVFLLSTLNNMRIVDDNRRCMDIEFRNTINERFLTEFNDPDFHKLFEIMSEDLFSDKGDEVRSKIYAECFLAF